MSPIVPMSFWADVRVVCYLLSILAADASDGPARDCNISTTVSCVLYEDSACFARIRAINEMQQKERTSWPGSPEGLQVEPFKATSSHTPPSVGLSVKWFAPSTSARLVKGYRLTVTSANGGGQHSTCRFIEISRQQGKSLENEQFVYPLGISNLTSQPQWIVEVESIPSCPYRPWSSSTAFVTIYDSFMEDTPLASGPMYWRTSYITAATTTTTQPDVTVNFAPASSSLGFASYTVALWRCDADSRQHCGVNFGLTLKARATVRQPNKTTTFYSMQAGLYLVSVEADNVGNVCGTYISCQKRRSQLFSAGVASPTSIAQSLTACYTYTTGHGSSSSFLASASSQTDSPREPLVSSEGNQQEPRMSSAPYTSESKFSAAPQEIKSSGPSNWKITFLSVAGAVLVLLMLIGSITVFCLRRKRQYKGSHNFQASPVRYDPVQSCPDQSILLPRSTIFLVSHSESRGQIDVTDALATYLKAFCFCDVIYYRWHLDELQRVGPEDWVNRHIENADLVAFVHTHDTEQKFWEWRTARKKSAGDTDVLTDRMLAQVFDDVGQSPEKCLNVTFLSSGLFAASFWRLVSSVRSRKHVSQSWVMPPERLCHGSISFENKDRHWNVVGNDSEVTEELVISEMEGRQLHEAMNDSPRIYRLMNDFSAFLADIHKLKPGAVALKSRGLPVDADHLSTQEGRTLYRSVAVLRSNMTAACKGLRSCASKYTCTDMNTPGDAGQEERIDSGFDDDYSPSFISPEELSPEDMGMTSVNEVLHALNARCGWEENGSIHAPDCYSLGWRDV